MIYLPTPADIRSAHACTGTHQDGSSKNGSLTCDMHVAMPAVAKTNRQGRILRMLRNEKIAVRGIGAPAQTSKAERSLGQMGHGLS